jgi:DNA-binding NarL/FixJ family response regulator
MTLTERQRRGLRLAAQGYTVEQIAHRLGVNPRTVKRDRSEAMSELDAPTIAVAIIKANQPRRRRAPSQDDTLELV